MPRPDEGMIHAWLDGALDAAESARVAKLVGEDPEWAASVAEARGLIAASSRIVTALDVVPGDVIPAGSRAAPATESQKRGFRVQPWMRIAAGLVLVAGVGYLSQRRDGERTVRSIADGALERGAVAPSAATPLVATPVVAPQASRPTPAVEPAMPQTVAPSDALRGEREERSKIADAALPAVSDSTSVATGSAKSVAQANAVAGGVAQPARRDARGAQGEVAAAAPAAPAAVTSAPAASAPAVALFRPREVTDRVRAMAATDADVATTLPGCWRVVSSVSLDSILLNPPIVRASGDTIVLRLRDGAITATLRRESETGLRGTLVDEGARAYPLTLTRITCP